MAAPSSSSKFMRLASIIRLLSPRNDIDNIILELLGQFSLEKIYSDADKKTYQALVIHLLVQLNVIFRIQRLCLPSEGVPIGRYLGHLASWEVSLRTMEFVLQVIVEGRESLFEARALRDNYLPEYLLNSVRFLTLHPKVPSNQRVKDRRDRLARIHRSLERVFDSYPGPEFFLLSICKEVTDSLRNDPDCFSLPPKLRAELPSLVTDQFYPLPECLSSQYVSTIVPPDGFSGNWLSQFLALRDVSQFIVGASGQYAANRETQDVRLQSSSARTRNAVLNALDNMRLPGYLAKIDLITTFNESFRIILPDTSIIGRRDSRESHVDEWELDAIDILCAKISDRQIINRVSDREVIQSISKIIRKIETFNDESGQKRSIRPKIYSINCPKCHLLGDTDLIHVRNEGLRLPMDLKVSQVILPLKSKCPICGEAVSMIREISLVRETWELLKPLELNADTINVERHLPSQFQLPSPRSETTMPQLGYRKVPTQTLHDTESPSPPSGQYLFSSAMWSERDQFLSKSLASPNSSSFRQLPDTPGTESSEALTPNSYFDALRTTDASVKSMARPTDLPLSQGGLVTGEGGSQSRLVSTSTMPFKSNSFTRYQSVPIVLQPDKGKSRWKKLTISRRESTKASGDSSSSSSSTLESQKLEEISLKGLMNTSRASFRGKGAKNINVHLSQNSNYALFWTQSTMNLFDIGTSPPILGRSVSPESTCVLAAVTKTHLAYVMGTANQKLTLRIVNLIQAGIPAVEYRMPSSPWCHSICICPQENYVIIGFDNATVRFFKTARPQEPREDRLHSKYPNHKDCKHCPPVDTVSFSNDGLNLLASTRSPKNGLIQIYTWSFPFEDFAELASCRYHVPLHESEDNGISSAIFRTGQVGEENLACITTWTQSGVPILVQPQDGHRCEIKTEASSHQGKLGTRIHCAAFSPSGRELAMVNHQGHLYHISCLNSSPLDVRRIAFSKELTTKSNSFAMTFTAFSDEIFIILAWTDSTKEIGYLKRIPIKSTDRRDVSMTTESLGTIPAAATPRYELPSVGREIPRETVELTAPMPEVPAPAAPLNIVKGGYPKENS